MLRRSFRSKNIQFFNKESWPKFDCNPKRKKEYLYKFKVDKL